MKRTQPIVMNLSIVMLILTGTNAMAIEEPQYEVLSSTDVYEVRRYESYIVAETDVAGGRSAHAPRIALLREGVGE